MQKTPVFWASPPQHKESACAFWHYLIAGLLVIFAVAVPLKLPLSKDMAFVLAFAAVVMSALWGGLGPAIFAVGLSLVMINYLFVPPFYRLSFDSVPENSLGSGIFFLTSLMVSAFVAGLRRTWEHALRSEERYRKLADTAPEALIVLDEHARIQYVNAQVERVFACPAASLLGEQLAQWVPKNVYENALLQLKHDPDSRRGSVPLDLPPVLRESLREAIDLSVATLTRHSAGFFALRMRVFPITGATPIILRPA